MHAGPQVNSVVWWKYGGGCAKRGSFGVSRFSKRSALPRRLLGGSEKRNAHAVPRMLGRDGDRIEPGCAAATAKQDEGVSGECPVAGRHHQRRGRRGDEPVETAARDAVGREYPMFERENRVDVRRLGWANLELRGGRAGERAIHRGRIWVDGGAIRKGTIG